MFLPYTERGGGERIAFMHGFTQTKKSWLPIIERLGDNVHSISFDAPGHGDAALLPFNCSDAATAVNNIAGGATYVGYSMGARIMLHAAVMFPEEVERLIMISGSPGLRTDNERQDRVQSDSALAEHCIAIGVEAFVDEWLCGPLFAGLNPETDQRGDRLTNTADGLAQSLRLCGTGSQDSLWDSLGSLEMPVLLVVGANDPKFRVINEEMCEAIGNNAQMHVIPDAGHSAHMEQPDTVAALIADFIG